VSETFVQVRKFVAIGSWLPTTHALIRLERRNILMADVLSGLETAEIVEDYPEDQRGPSVLILSQDGAGLPIHALWGIPNNNTSVANLVTVYRPDPLEWFDDWKTRR
jgi:Domain of unknown function (DUF4258)